MDKNHKERNNGTKRMRQSFVTPNATRNFQYRNYQFCDTTRHSSSVC